MRKLLFIAALLFVFTGNLKSQTTIHGQAEPVVLYELHNGSFFKVITSDIWVYANGDYGIATPYTLQPGPPPEIEGIPMIDFRPMSCYDAKVAYGRTAVRCGPYSISFVGNQRVVNCGGTDQTTCEIKFKKDGVDYVLENPQVQ